MLFNKKCRQCGKSIQKGKFCSNRCVGLFNSESGIASRNGRLGGKALKGIKKSKNHIVSLSKAHLGYVMPKKQKDKIAKALSGIKRSLKTRARLSIQKIGNKNPMWNKDRDQVDYFYRLRSRYQFTTMQKEEIYKRYNGKCAICGSTEKLEYDHIIPIRFGGTNDKENSQLLCHSDHKIKSVMEWNKVRMNKGGDSYAL